MSDARDSKRQRTRDATSKPDVNGAARAAHNVFVASIDQGTTSTRFLIFDTTGQPVASHQMGFENIHPRSG